MPVCCLEKFKLAVKLISIFHGQGVGPKNHVLDGVQIPRGSDTFEGGLCWPMVMYLPQANVPV